MTSCGVPSCFAANTGTGVCIDHRQIEMAEAAAVDLPPPHVYGDALWGVPSELLDGDQWVSQAAAGRSLRPVLRHMDRLDQLDREPGGWRLQDVLYLVQSAVPGVRNNTLNRASFIAGRMVAEGRVSYDMARLGLIAAAEEVGLSRFEARSTIESGLEAGLSA